MMSEECSSPNLAFAKLLEENGIEFEREFSIQNSTYDFKVGNTCIEIDPSATHSPDWSPFKTNRMTKKYHKEKSDMARANGYDCIHVFDWDDQNKIVNLLKKREPVYARNCEIKEVSIKDAIEFLNENHLQGYARDSIRLGLYNNNELVQIMTFGKPRYNKKFQYEIVRLCSSKYVIGGAEKLFNHFLKMFNVTSVISYCDLSKFNGDVYHKLGFTKEADNKPSRHWYGLSNKAHITDNLLRQRGFDQLFGTDYGKGTSNESLMFDYGFVSVYDCGQARFVYNAA